jgi:hypothetical protein
MAASVVVTLALLQARTQATYSGTDFWLPKVLSRMAHPLFFAHPGLPPQVPAIIQAAIVPVLDWVRGGGGSDWKRQRLTCGAQLFYPVAVGLTSLENHKRQRHYDTSLSLKLFLVMFVNAFFVQFMIAFAVGSYEYLRLQLALLLLFRIVLGLFSRAIPPYVPLVRT